MAAAPAPESKKVPTIRSIPVREKHGAHVIQLAQLNPHIFSIRSQSSAGQGVYSVKDFKQWEFITADPAIVYVPTTDKRLGVSDDLLLTHAMIKSGHDFNWMVANGMTGLEHMPDPAYMLAAAETLKEVCADTKCGLEDLQCAWSIVRAHMHNVGPAIGVPGPTGLVMYHIAALFNHSCAPNVLMCNGPKETRLYALRPISKNDELTVGYAGNLEHAGLLIRSSALYPSLKTQCLCARCAKERKVYEKLTEGERKSVAMTWFAEHVQSQVLDGVDAAWYVWCRDDDPRQRRVAAFEVANASLLNKMTAHSWCARLTALRQVLDVVHTTLREGNTKIVERLGANKLAEAAIKGLEKADGAPMLYYMCRVVAHAITRGWMSEEGKRRVDATLPSIVEPSPAVEGVNLEQLQARATSRVITSQTLAVPGPAEEKKRA